MNCMSFMQPPSNIFQSRPTARTTFKEYKLNGDVPIDSGGGGVQRIVNPLPCVSFDFQFLVQCGTVYQKLNRSENCRAIGGKINTEDTH